VEVRWGMGGMSLNLWQFSDDRASAARRESNQLGRLMEAQQACEVRKDAMREREG
jgi:hypothetical protein